MGSNAMIMCKKTGDYIQLQKSFYPNDDDVHTLDEDIQPIAINALLRFLNEHQGEELVYGSAQGITDFVEYILERPIDYLRTDEDYHELDYSFGT